MDTIKCFDGYTNVERKILEQTRLLGPLLYGRCKHLSFLVKRNRIVSIGNNSYTKTHPLSFRFGHRDSLQHSELSAILNFPYSPRELKGFDLYNVRLTKTNSIKLSKPCRSCFSLLNYFGIKNVFYTNDYGMFVQEEML